MKLITIGIPFYNNETTLEYAIISTLRQTHSQLEIFLVNDGSTDESLNIARQYEKKDKRIKVIDDKKNIGLIARLNQIIDLAQGEYIARMDADDMMDSERIEKQFSYLENNSEVDVITTGLVSLNNEYTPQGKRCCQNTVPDIYNVFKSGEDLLHASMVARRSWFKANKYLEGFDRAEDRELFTRTLGTSIYRILPEPLYYYLDVQNITLSKYLKSYESERKALIKNWKFKLSRTEVALLFLRSSVKSIVIRLIFLLGRDQRLLERKNMPLSQNEASKIEHHLKEILA